MKLRNNFTDKTRALYLGKWECDLCSSNQMLEINHIRGRESNSPLNASILCRQCHEHVGHSEEEEQELFFKNLVYLKNIGYELTESDSDFMEANFSRLIERNPRIKKWLQAT